MCIIILTLLFIIFFIVVITSFSFSYVMHENILRDTENRIISLDTISLKKIDKLKILIIQDGAYEKYHEYIKYSMEINKIYCDKWGYEYKFITHNIDTMPPYWLKVYDMNKYINENKYDYVMYLDVDAIFYNHNYSLENILIEIKHKANKTFDIYIGTDTPNSNANTGVFLVKNTIITKNILNEWIDNCFIDEKIVNKCLAWNYDTYTHKWNCKLCSWAGNNYEQGVFNNFYKKYKKNIAILDRSLFSNENYKTKSYILHVMGKKKNNILNIFKNVYNSLTINNDKLK